MLRFRIFTLVVLAVLFVASCSDVTPEDDGTQPTSAATQGETAKTTTTSPFSTTTTTTTIPVRLVTLLEEPPPFEEITLPTADGLELYAKYWPGGPVAVLAGHDFHTASDATDGANPQSSDNLLWWTGVLADSGYTVLSPDYRGHGQSPESPSVKNSPVDLKAAYEFLVTEGYQTIVLAGMVGSGTAGVVLDAEDPDVDFAGLALIWSAPQEVSLNAQQVLYGIDAPVYIVSFQDPRLERWAKLMAAEIADVYDLYIYSPPPSGASFTDVHGEEFAGRLLDFVDYVAASA